MIKKRIKIGPILVSVMVWLSVVSPVLVTASNKKVTITEKTGMVQVRRKTSNKFFESFVDMNISQGDTIIAGPDGEVVMRINDKNTLTAGKSTAFSFTDLSETAVKDNTHVKLIYGSLFHDVTEKQVGNKTYQVETSNTIMGVRGTKFAVSNTLVDGKETTTVLALEGEVTVEAIPLTKQADNLVVSKPISVKGGEMIEVITATNEPISMEKTSIDFSTLNVDTLEWILTLEAVDNEYIEGATKSLPQAKKAEALVISTPMAVESKAMTLAEILADKEAYIDEKPVGEAEEDDEVENIIPIPDKKPIYLSHEIDRSGRIITFTFDTDLDTASELVITNGDNKILTVVAGNQIEADFTLAENKLYTISFSKVQSDTGKISVDTTSITFDLSTDEPIPGGSVININNINDLKRLSTEYGVSPLGDETNHVTINLNKDINWNIDTHGKFTGFVIGNGTFNGKGHTINSLVIAPLDTATEAGFISLVTGKATIKNLVIDEAVGDFSSAAPTNGIGILIGRGQDITVENVTIKNSLLLAGGSNGGAIIGHVSGGDITIKNVDLTDITIENPVSTVTALGIAIGITQGDAVTIENLDVENCTINAGSQAGGVVGHLKNSGLTKFTDVEVKNISITTGEFGGGLIGKGESQSYLLKNISVVKAIITGTNYIGGGFGKITGQGVIDTITVTSPIITGVNYIGGLGGSIDGHITLKNVTVESKNASITCNIIASGNNVGGIAGAVTDIIAKELEVDNVIITNTQGNNIGGIFGWMKDSTLENAQVGDLTITTTNGSNIAGMVGLAEGGQFSGKMELEDTHITGMGADIGGFFGELDGSSPISFTDFFVGKIDNVNLPADGGFVVGRMLGDIQAVARPIQVKINTLINGDTVSESQYVNTDNRTDTSQVLFDITLN